MGERVRGELQQDVEGRAAGQGDPLHAAGGEGTD